MTTASTNSIGTLPSLPQLGKVAEEKRGILFLLMLAFMISLVVPVYIRAGPVLLMPHRIVLLISFVPSLIVIFTGKAGRVLWIDYLMLASVGCAVLSYMVNENPLLGRVQPIGIIALEFFGAYMLGRAGIRSTAQFMSFVKIFFGTALILVPFAAMESLTHRAVLLEIIPKSVEIVYTAERWGMRRAQAVFGHPILFGVYISVGFGVFWYSLNTATKRLFSAPLVIAGTVFSLSTGALMSVVFQTLFIAWELVFKKFKNRWRVFGALSILLYLAIDLLSNRTPFHVLITYATFNTGSAYNRILIWRYGMENIWANPWLGLGQDVLNWARPAWMSSSADNFWLLMAMKYGIPMFLFMSIAIFLIFRGVAKANLTDPVAQRCRAGFLVAMGGLILAGGTVHYWHAMMAYILFFIGSGVWMINGNTGTVELAEGEAERLAEEEQANTPLGSYSRQTKRHVRGAATKAPEPKGPSTRFARQNGGAIPPSRARLAKYRRQDES